MEVGRRVCRDERSPEKGRLCVQTRMMGRPMFKKVEVVYYLSRNGHLEHPHYMEVTHLAHHQLRLKDVMDRLRSLRGKTMPSLYSWSCKRSYKNGYVWNDLCENDAIYPSDGAEYVLKGSELGDTCNEKLQSLQLGNNAQQSSALHPKIGPLVFKRRPVPEEVSAMYNEDRENAQEIEEDEEEECGVKTISNVSHIRYSRGVSTDQIDQEFKPEKPRMAAPNESSLDSHLFSSPPSTTSSETIIVSSSNNNNNNESSNNIVISQRSEDGSPAAANELWPSRNSMLLSLIACGGTASFRKALSAAPSPSLTAAKPSPARKSHRRAAAMEEEMMIGRMSENPRGFGNHEEKEYFSGSIVESVGNQSSHSHPGLKKSSSHNEERSNSTGLGEAAATASAAAAEDVEKDNNVAIGKCIPRRKTSSKQPKK